MTLKEKSLMKRKPLLVVLDSHAIIHRAYHALPPLTSPSGKPVQAVYGLLTMLLRIINELKPDVVAAAYDLPGGTHRHQVYKEYKGKRAEIDESLVEQLSLSRDALTALGIPIYDAPGFEADDVIGTIVEKKKKKYDIIIASGDMDTLQLVEGKSVRVFTLRKGLTDTVLYDEAAVESRFGFSPEQVRDYKGLAGDTSDNIVGIPGIGEKSATELIKKFGTVEKMYSALKKNKNALVIAGFRERIQNLVTEHEDEALFSKMLATIRKDAPVTFDDSAGVIETFSVERAVAYANEMGFRSLVPRFKKLGGVDEQPKTEFNYTQKEEGRAKAANPSAQLFDTGAKDPLFPECAVLTWLLNPETTDPTPDDVYAAAGTGDMTEAHRILLEKVKKENLDKVFFDIEKPLIPVVAEMSKTGVLIDRSRLDVLSKEFNAELKELERMIHKDAGVEFNVASPKQLGDVLFNKMKLGGTKQKKTAGGQLSTKESELQKIVDQHPIINKVLRYRELAKLLGTYVDAIPPYLDAESRLHSTFIQTGAATGRMASKDPGVQNIPVKTEDGRKIRSAFVAGKGKVLLALDYSQIELRLAAILSGDEKLCEVFRRGGDVHAAVAASVFGVEESEVNKEMRRRAKVINFGILYGMGVNALREQLGGDRKEAQEFMNTYFATFTTLSAYLDKSIETAKKLGYTTTLYGRKRYFPGFKSPLPFIRASAERMAINAPIQGSQSDIMKLAMVKVSELIKDKFPGACALILQIHDELIFECDKKQAEAVVAEIRALMEHVLDEKVARGVPTTVVASTGTSWDDMREL